jgi:hypothetical protein
MRLVSLVYALVVVVAITDRVVAASSQAPAAWLTPPAAVASFVRVPTPADGARYDVVARYVRRNTTADVFLSMLQPSTLASEDLLWTQARALANALPSMYDDFALGAITKRDVHVRNERFVGVLMVGAVRRGSEITPTYAFFYAVRDRLLEIRITGGEPSDGVLRFVDHLLPQLIQPMPAH